MSAKRREKMVRMERGIQDQQVMSKIDGARVVKGEEDGLGTHHLRREAIIPWS